MRNRCLLAFALTLAVLALACGRTPTTVESVRGPCATHTDTIRTNAGVIIAYQRISSC